ncbi:MAG: hypothetical protein ACLR2P_18065, partial [Bilophila wadsworthia]
LLKNMKFHLITQRKPASFNLHAKEKRQGLCAARREIHPVADRVSSRSIGSAPATDGRQRKAEKEEGRCAAGQQPT